MLYKYFSVSLIIFRVRSQNGITKAKDINLFKTFSEYYHFYLQKYYILIILPPVVCEIVCLIIFLFSLHIKIAGAS